ncbi:MAG: MarR family transcriptional regulator [Pseudomonadota bacterium]
MRYRLHDSLGYRISLAARIQERRLDQGLKEIGLTRLTWCILLAVGNEDLNQPSDIAGYLRVDRSAISRALGQMETQDLIARDPGEADGRTRAVRLTELGRERLVQGSPIAVENNAIMAKQLGASDVDELKGLLDTLIEGAPAIPKL